ncbi:hypothetical protein AVEN_197763-1 [Araneus ventricosus]|uniref:Uncharacterized protein n=1 Tax=Araneus ventricosus TaxID=182803 RepID=A0A4Y2NTF3_ARAVE|nr:hypothetical protein AVEN_197763-1 [Araneus ventricosus]
MTYVLPGYYLSSEMGLKILTILGNHLNHPTMPWHPDLHERPAAAADNLALWPPHNSHLYEWFMRRPTFCLDTTYFRRWILRSSLFWVIT